MKYNFPKKFLWGSAASALQTEGASHVDGKTPTIWDYWYEKDKTAFFNKTGPEKAPNFYKMYKEDIANMKAINLNSYRTSISWARLLPDGKNINPQAVKFYNNLIDEMIDNDIEPIVNLFHFDMPMLMQNKGGWESREVIENFAFYAKKVFDIFGDRVKKWITFNEPIVPVEAGYLYKMHYPLVTDMKRAVQVGYNTMLASSKVVEKFKKLNLDGDIGIILNLTPSYSRSKDKEDLKAANLVDLMFNRSFLDPSVLGEYPIQLVKFLKENDLTPKWQEKDLDIIKNNTVDFLGVNYYQPRRIQKRETPIETKSLMPENFFEYYIWPERKMNVYRGWEIYEKGLYDIGINIKNNYKNISWFVSENGMGVENEERFIDENGMVQDNYRIDFIREHLKWLHKSIEEGSNCFGYHLWTFMDNWSWCNAYKNRYGFYRVDLENNFKRSLKKSGLWIKKVAKNNGFDD